MASEKTRREWFDLGARSFALACPGKFDQPVYACPICLDTFTVDAMADRTLTSEHVPPASVGGVELLLTCKSCNNSAGTKVDAHAKKKEDVELAMAGVANRPHRVRAMIGDLKLQAELHTSNGQYQLRIPAHLNKPGTGEVLKKVATAGTRLTLQNEPYSELGAKISWLRSGYLALFAIAGYSFALDPAIQIVRQQILECDERKMITFTSEAQQDFPLSVRRILRVLEPDWHRGWVVQFGRYLVQFPSPGDLTFYERIARYGSTGLPELATYQNEGWPTRATFGL